MRELVVKSTHDFPFRYDKRFATVNNQPRKYLLTCGSPPFMFDSFRIRLGNPLIISLLCALPSFVFSRRITHTTC